MCELCGFTFQTEMRLASIRYVFSKILRQITHNKIKTAKTFFYVFYLYIFFTKVVKLMKMILKMYSKRRKLDLISIVFCVYLTIILLQVFYVIRAEYSRLFKLFQYLRVNSQEVRIQCRDRLKRQQERQRNMKFKTFLKQKQHQILQKENGDEIINVAN